MVLWIALFDPREAAPRLRFIHAGTATLFEPDRPATCPSDKAGRETADKPANRPLRPSENWFGPEHGVHIHDMHQHEVASHATQHGIRSLPAVVIDGKLAGCSAGWGCR
jgi:glutaredoxin